MPSSSPSRAAPPVAGASFLPPNARNPLGQPAVRGGLQGGGEGESAPLLGGGGGGQQQQQALMVPQQDQYLASRNEALHQVESTIVELGGIFQQLAHMVGGAEGRGGGSCRGRLHRCMWLRRQRPRPPPQPRPAPAPGTLLSAGA